MLFKKGKLKLDFVQIALLFAGLYFFYKVLLAKDEGFFLYPRKDVSAVTTTQNIGRFRNKPSLVLFKANWCGFCKKFWPEWKKFGGNVNGIPLVTLDNEAHSQLMKLHNVAVYPMIMYLPHGPFSREGCKVYTGPRTYADLLNWINTEVSVK